MPVNDELLSQLVEMGISDTVGRKGLVNGGSLEGALNWITEHQDDADINQVPFFPHQLPKNCRLSSYLLAIFQMVEYC